MAIREVQVHTGPTGATRYIDANPAVREKFNTYKDAGKVATNPITETVDGGNTIKTVTSVWSDHDAYNEYKAWLRTNHMALVMEHNANAGIVVETTVTEE